MGNDPNCWHALSAETCAERLRADIAHGLAQAEAERRLSAFGRNRIEEHGRRSLLSMLFHQFTDFMILVLIAAAVISGLVGDAIDTIAILVIITLNATIGFIQEYRADRAIAALRKMAEPTVAVRRNGCEQTVAAEDLVPGEIVLLEAGNVVAADLRLVETTQLRTDESAITGESLPVDKSAVAVTDTTALPDRTSMAYKGTTVVRGRATGLVVATAMRTELGRIASLLASEESRQTPLQKRLAVFGRQLSIVVLGICAIVFVVGLLRGEPALLMFLTAVSLAVAAIPEALPAVVTISLALGARIMARHNALVRHLPAVETLGSVTTICSDKTGTLTENRMRADRYSIGGAEHCDLQELPTESREELARAMLLNNDAHADGTGELRGDPTEVALHRAALTAGFDAPRLERDWPRVDEISFVSGRQRMLTIHRSTDGRYLALVKGSPEAVLPCCSRGSDGFAIERITEDAQHMAADGLRVLAFGCKQLDEVPADLGEAECDLRFLGLVGLLDPPRAEARAAVTEARRAGVNTVMITGDHPGTARNIAGRLGIIRAGDDVTVGADLAELSDDELGQVVREARVYARVSPEQKLEIVRALQSAGECVAVTGDGVNDAPALKRAEIGIAMGRCGTDVAREAADLVLLDDNFATIVSAIREGRRIFDNIRRFVRFGMTTNAGEVWTLFLAPLLGLPLPLLPIQILWINLVTDGLPGLALSAEPAERTVMRRRPRAVAETLFSDGLGYHIVWVGLLMGGMAIVTQAWAYHAGNPSWQTMVFTVLTLTQMGHVIAVRSDRESLLTLGLWSNRPLLGAVSLTVILQMAVLYLPALQPIFKTEALTAPELALCFALAGVVLLAVEAEKWLVRRGALYRPTSESAA